MLSKIGVIGGGNIGGVLIQEIARLKSILDNRSLQLQIIKDELLEARKKYGDERRTEILDAQGDLSMEDLIAEEEMVITVSRGGYIKRTALSTYRAQHRGGRGRRGMEIREEDVVERLFVASTHATMLFFSSTGRVFARKVQQLPDVGSRLRLGKHLGPDDVGEEGP